jgi:hypothetical protein
LLKLTLVMRKRDGGVVDAELLRPRAWIEAAGIAVGKPLPLNLPELNIRDEVSVTAIEACPPIASGAGSVVTARFVTREAHLVASVQLRGPGGELETLTGTELHPIWSADRADWIPLSQLQPGERLLCSHPSTSWDGESERGQAHAIVLGVTLSTVCEHVYQVGELGVLVHNGTPAHCPLESVNAPIKEADEVLSRLGTSRESASRLGRKAEEAEKVIGIHGVSVSGATPTSPASQAARKKIEEQFRVHDTPTRNDPLHKTVELPKPVTQAVADLFNSIFGR